MGKITELYDQRAALSAELSALRSSFESADEPSEEQVASISDLRGKVDSVTAQIHKIEATRQHLEDMQASIDATAPRSLPALGNVVENPSGFSPLSIPRTLASKVERDAKSRLTGLAAKVYGKDAGLAALGAQFVGALHGDKSCADAVRAEYQEYGATMNTQQNSAGGFLVPSDLLPTLIDLREQYGVVGRNANVINVSAPTGSIPRRTGRPAAVFINEPRSADIATGDLSFDQVNYQVKPIASFTPASFELEEDSLIDISALVFRHAMEEFAYTEDNCAFNGTGTSAFGGIRGILNILEDAAHAGSSITAGSGEITYGTLKVDTLTGAVGLIPDYANDGAKWFGHRAALGNTFDRLKMTAGGNTIQIVEGRTIRQWGGYPIEVSQVLNSTLTTLAGLSGPIFGNMAQACHLFRKGGILMARSTEAQFMKAHVVYRTIQRFDFVMSERGTATAAGPLVRIKFAAS